MNSGIDPNLMVNEGFLYLCFAIGFIVFMIADSRASQSPLENLPVTTNYGSRMFYAIWSAAIVTAGLLASYLVTYGSYALFPNSLPDAYFLSYPGIMLLLGGALGKAAVFRAQDAGKGRGTAFFAIIPFINIWLFMAAPKASPTRPPYTPSATALRFMVGFAAVSLIVVANGLSQTFSDMFADKQVTHRVLNIAEQQRESLPIKLDEITTLYDIRVDQGRKTFSYFYRLTEPRPTRQQMESYLTNTMKPAHMDAWCQDTMITEFNWAIWYRYLDEQERPIAEMSIGLMDCLKSPNG